MKHKWVCGDCGRVATMTTGHDCPDARVDVLAEYERMRALLWRIYDRCEGGMYTHEVAIDIEDEMPPRPAY